jgi:(E)-4-hydroxy-3-methylbut-2-enyl-diphosphate synthase
VFIDGEKKLTLRGDNIAQEFTALIDAYVEHKYKRG